MTRSARRARRGWRCRWSPRVSYYSHFDIVRKRSFSSHTHYFKAREHIAFEVLGVRVVKEEKEHQGSLVEQEAMEVSAVLSTFPKLASGAVDTDVPR